ncbi:TonB-dependent receptor [candidate division KSB1 bacterium]|nr:TonB-dependent receptor [candidate division KSB1 bacterium]
MSLPYLKRLALMTGLVLIPSLMLANTGKFAGRVVDKESGDPLPGVNVQVEGTSLGSATNTNGEYVILNVPSGKYTLKASFIGYAVMRVENLRISIGSTTRQDFALSTEVISGEEVVIVATRPMVQKDLTSSQKTTTADEIEALPVLTFSGVVETQAGVNRGADGALHIRGGRSNEVAYYIDGVAVNNPFFTNSLAINVSNKALEELRVVSGAFNAEYGNAMSGIINIQIKEGGPKYHGSFSGYFGDYISNADDIYLNIDDINPFARSVFEGTLNGPVPGFGNKFTFNISGKINDNEGYHYGVREHVPGDSANFTNSDAWYIEMGGDSAYVPMNPSSGYNTLTKLTWRISPQIKLSGQLLYDYGKVKPYTSTSHQFRFNPDGMPTEYSSNANYSLKFNHAFTNTFYEAHLFQSTTNFDAYLYENPEDPRYVPTGRVVGTPASPYFVFGGMDMTHTYRDSKSIGAKFDITSQINARHELKSGVSFRQDNLQEENFTILYDGFRYREPTVLPRNGSPSHSYYDKNALFLSAYGQDKIEYKDMIVNAGVRYDYFDPQDDYFESLLDPDVNAGGTLTAAEPKHMVAPRLGVAFPITDRGILHFSYGHFYQLPTMRLLYATSVFGAGGAPTVGYANLKPQKTVNYEFGLQQQLTDVLALETVMFFKDIRELLALQTIRYNHPVYGPASYSVYLNKDYGTVKGFTFSINKRYDAATKLSASLDYTYQKAEGNDVRSGAFYVSALSGVEEEKEIVPLDWDQTHLLNATVGISDPGNWGVSFIGKLQSGWPYTPEILDANYIPEANSGRKPWQKNVDMRVHKTVKFHGLDFVLFVQAFNLFDTRNERYVFDDTGRAGYTYARRSSQETAELISHYGDEGIHTWTEYQTQPRYYLAPRSVLTGLSLEF